MEETGIVAQAAWQQVDSFEVWVGEINALVQRALSLLKGLRIEQERLADQLKEALAKDRRLRKRDFDSIVAALYDDIRAEEEALEQLLAGFYQEKRQMVADMRKFLCQRPTADELARAKRAWRRQKGTEAAVAQALCNYQIGQEELRSGLKCLLEKSSPTVLDLKSFVQNVRVLRKHRAGEAAEMWDQLRRVNDEIKRDWRKLLAASANDHLADQGSTLCGIDSGA